MKTYYIAQELYLMLCGALNGKEIQKRGEIYIHIYIYIYRERERERELIYFAVQQKLTQHCKATIFQKKLVKIK